MIKLYFLLNMCIDKDVLEAYKKIAPIILEASTDLEPIQNNPFIDENVSPSNDDAIMIL